MFIPSNIYFVWFGSIPIWVIRYHVLNIFDTFDVFQYVSRCSSSNIDVLLRHSDFGCKKGPRSLEPLEMWGILGLRKHHKSHHAIVVLLNFATGIARWWLPSMRMILVYTRDVLCQLLRVINLFAIWIVTFISDFNWIL